MNRIYSAYPDEQILSRMGQEDDVLAFEELYSRYFKTIFNFTYSKVNDRFTTQEIVQETFVQLWQQRNGGEILNCRAFIFTIAKRQIISHYRKEFTRQKHYSEWEKQQTDGPEQADQQSIVSDLQHRYEEGLHLLPPKCQEVFVLSRQGFPNRQIGEQLAISEKTVEQHITKALRILKAHLREHMIGLLLFLFF